MSLADIVLLLQSKQCQEWTREFVELLVRLGIMLHTALQVLDEAKALETA